MTCHSKYAVFNVINLHGTNPKTQTAAINCVRHLDSVRFTEYKFGLLVVKPVLIWALK